MRLSYGLIIAALFSTFSSAFAGDESWTYHGKKGMKSWKEDYKECEGNFQSPIDIDADLYLSFLKPTFSYKPVRLTLQNNGHTVEVSYPSGSFVMLENQKYELLQFHFHTPSEHKIKGESYPMEIHFVHKDAEGKLGVIGVMVKEGEKNTIIDPIIKHTPRNLQEPKMTHENIMINAKELMPEELKYYRYRGSLTTPPCSEGVNWFVLKEPIEFSKQQIEAFKKVIGMNARDVQEVGHRIILAEKR